MAVARHRPSLGLLIKRCSAGAGEAQVWRSPGVERPRCAKDWGWSGSGVGGYLGHVTHVTQVPLVTLVTHGGMDQSMTLRWMDGWMAF